MPFTNLEVQEERTQYILCYGPHPSQNCCRGITLVRPWETGFSGSDVIKSCQNPNLVDENQTRYRKLTCWIKLVLHLTLTQPPISVESISKSISWLSSSKKREQHEPPGLVMLVSSSLSHTQPASTSMPVAISGSKWMVVCVSPYPLSFLVIKKQQ